jgi:hypothetical protein
MRIEKVLPLPREPTWLFLGSSMPVAYEWSYKKNFGSFFMAGPIIQAVKMLNKTGRSDKIVLRIILKNL